MLDLEARAEPDLPEIDGQERTFEGIGVMVANLGMANYRLPITSYISPSDGRFTVILMRAGNILRAGGFVPCFDREAASEALRGLLAWNLQRRLDAEAPTHVEVPSGSRVPIDYGAEEPVLVPEWMRATPETTQPSAPV